MNTLMSLKGKIIAAAIAIGLISIALFNFGLGGNPTPPIVNESKQPAAVLSSEPQLISTVPSELFEKKPLIFAPDKIIELNFNAELENGPETKLTFDPPLEFEAKLTDDFKTAKIYPKKPYKLGQGYTLFIKPDTKLRGGKTLGKGYSFQFNVINYSGI